MLAQHRREQIKSLLDIEGSCIVTTVAVQFGVSEETVRRDLEILEKEGVCQKTYGGAVAVGDRGEQPFLFRKKSHVAEKNLIGRLAAAEVKDGDRIMLDASSTALYIAKHLVTKKNLTVVTNSVEILVELSQVSGWHIYSTGGTLNEGSLALVGTKADKLIGEFHVDKAFISCKGYDLKGGCTDSSEVHACTKSAMLAAADRTFLAADGSKFDKISFALIAPPDAFHTVITNSLPAKAWQDYFAAAGVRLLVQDS
ncbi:MAG: DeoR/GlpR family DNA-binding transcription regulator [Clostridiales bacterium]|jgi:DeoR/GlpR family transcriptional regulator of sugar metabolism|nr:DeoR/GlpR family DNA-binding transcription regulator [Clostridiales bacterium]